jgi:hypothetical protein
MTFTDQQVEWIVVEVIRRLGLMQKEATTELHATTAELTMNDKLITLRSLEGKLTGISRLSVTNRAVVTPAARDELKQRQITLIRQA